MNPSYFTPATAFLFFFFAILPELINLEFQVLLVHAVCRHINKQQIILFLLRTPKKLETYSATFPTHWINKLCPWVLIDKPVQILPAIHVQSACVGFPPTVQSQACYLWSWSPVKKTNGCISSNETETNTHTHPPHPSKQSTPNAKQRLYALCESAHYKSKLYIYAVKMFSLFVPFSYVLWFLTLVEN